MAIYRFQVIMPQNSLLPRDVIVNNLHFNHLVGEPIVQTDLDGFCDSLIDLYQSHYGSTTAKVTVKAYELKPAPNFPVADRTKGTGSWPASCPREVALCLSFARNAAIPSERGRVYLSPGARIGATQTFGERPSDVQTQWAAGFYGDPNNSFPDLGGVDWEFGIHSPSTGKWSAAKVGWCDNEWDTVRSRGLRATTRQSWTREG